MTCTVRRGLRWPTNTIHTTALLWWGLDLFHWSGRMEMRMMLMWTWLGVQAGLHNSRLTAMGHLLYLKKILLVWEAGQNQLRCSGHSLRLGSYYDMMIYQFSPLSYNRHAAWRPAGCLVCWHVPVSVQKLGQTQEAGFLAKLLGGYWMGFAPTMSLAITAVNLGQSGRPSLCLHTARTQWCCHTDVSVGCGLGRQPRSQFPFGCGEGVPRLHKMESLNSRHFLTMWFFSTKNPGSKESSQERPWS